MAKINCIIFKENRKKAIHSQSYILLINEIITKKKLFLCDIL